MASDRVVEIASDHVKHIDHLVGVCRISLTIARNEADERDELQWLAQKAYLLREYDVSRAREHLQKWADDAGYDISNADNLPEMVALMRVHCADALYGAKHGA